MVARAGALLSGGIGAVTIKDRLRRLGGMKRSLLFRNYDDVLAEAERLAAGGYEKTGNWALGEVCDHIARTMERSLDGFSSRHPLPVRLIARWFVLGRILKHKPLGGRFPAPGELLPPGASDDRAGLGHLKAAVER